MNPHLGAEPEAVLVSSGAPRPLCAQLWAPCACARSMPERRVPWCSPQALLLRDQNTRGMDEDTLVVHACARAHFVLSVPRDAHSTAQTDGDDGDGQGGRLWAVRYGPRGKAP